MVQQPNKDNTTTPPKGMEYETMLCTGLCEADLLSVGFEKIPHFTITNSLIYKLGRHRHLSVGCVGTPNEMLWICETDDQDQRRVTDLVCLHNWDYDKYLTIEKVKGLINLINGSAQG